METATLNRQSKLRHDLKIAGITVLLFVFLFFAIQRFQQKTASPSPVVSSAVINSGLDGSVWQVKRWLNRTANDPDSIQFVEWSRVRHENGVYTVRCKFRAKNGLGAYQVEDRVFHLNARGDVIDVVALP